MSCATTVCAVFFILSFSHRLNHNLLNKLHQRPRRLAKLYPKPLPRYCDLRIDLTRVQSDHITCQVFKGSDLRIDPSRVQFVEFTMR